MERVLVTQEDARLEIGRESINNNPGTGDIAMKFICSNDEDYRCHRLLSVLGGLAEESLEHELLFDVWEDITALEDHKGVLIVHWRLKQREVDMVWLMLVVDLWSLYEPRDNVECRYGVTHRAITKLIDGRRTGA